MRTTWRATYLGLMMVGPLLTACGGGDDRAQAEPAATTSSAAPTTGVYGEPADREAGEPSEVATDPSPTPASAPRAAAADPAASVTPRLTYFGWNSDTGAVEAGGTVPSIVESDGRCTLTLSGTGTQVDASSAAVDNVTSTSCSEMVVPGERLSPGTWQAVLTYASATARGTSAAVEIEVP